ncbi:MAG: hypothetical protein JRN52_09805 [Nitrososphaerota archaeon]|nr:hypothetical protein [Nitrososphaerota archaeon]
MKFYVLTSLILSFAGAALDIASASPSLLMTTNTRANMYVAMPFDASSLVLPLYVFTIILVVTGIAGVLPFGINHMKIVGGLMVCYGIAMALIGYAMWADAGMLLANMMLLGIAMLVLGALMLINGSAMIYMRATMMNDIPNS